MVSYLIHSIFNSQLFLCFRPLKERMRLALQNVMEEYAHKGESFYVDVFYGIRKETGLLEVNG